MSEQQSLMKWSRKLAMSNHLLLAPTHPRGALATTGIRVVAKEVNGITISTFEMEAY
jgi:hypothetical protein